MPCEYMQTKYKRHQPVILIHDANPEYVEYQNEDDPDFEEVPVIKGMKGKINVLLPNGQYHVEILNDKEETIAYAVCSEDDLEPSE